MPTSSPPWASLSPSSSFRGPRTLGILFALRGGRGVPPGCPLITLSFSTFPGPGLPTGREHTSHPRSGCGHPDFTGVSFYQLQSWGLVLMVWSFLWNTSYIKFNLSPNSKIKTKETSPKPRKDLYLARKTVLTYLFFLSSAIVFEVNLMLLQFFFGGGGSLVLFFPLELK